MKGDKKEEKVKQPSLFEPFFVNINSEFERKKSGWLCRKSAFKNAGTFFNESQANFQERLSS